MMIRKQTYSLPLSIFLTGLIIRLLFIFTLGAEEKMYDSLSDQYVYFSLAQNIVAGHGFSTSYDVFVADAYEPTSIQPPLYSLLLSLLFYLFGESLLVVRLFQALLGAGICMAVYLIGSRFVDKPTGLAAGLITAAYPLAVMYTRPLITETLYTFFIILIILLTTRILTSFGYLHFAIGGVLFGLTFLVRPEIVMFAPLLLVCGFAWNLKQKQYSILFIAKGATLAALTFIIVIAPWGIRNYFAHGEFVLLPSKRWASWEENWLRYTRETAPEWEASCNGQDVLICSIPNFENLSELERDRYAEKLGTDFIIANPHLYLRYGVSRFLRSYPLIPRESLPPPLGFNDESPERTDGYHFTSLDDFPRYLTGIEKLRVWSFRLLFGLMLLGVVMAFRRRQWGVLAITLPIIFNMGLAFLFFGSERARLPVDPYITIIAAYSLVIIFDYVRHSVLARKTEVAAPSTS